MAVVDDGAGRVYELIGRAIEAGSQYEQALLHLVNTLIDSPRFAPVVTTVLQEKGLRDAAVKLLDRHVEFAQGESIFDGRFPVAEVPEVKSLVRRGGALIEKRHPLAHAVLGFGLNDEIVLTKQTRRDSTFEFTPSDEDYLARLIIDLREVSSAVWNVVMRMQGIAGRFPDVPTSA